MLVDFKAGQGRARKDGTRAAGLDRTELGQLVGCALTDYSDRVAIRTVALFVGLFLLVHILITFLNGKVLLHPGHDIEEHGGLLLGELAAFFVIHVGDLELAFDLGLPPLASWRRCRSAGSLAGLSRGMLLILLRAECTRQPRQTRSGRLLSRLAA
jgi:hypothetical protein